MIMMGIMASGQLTLVDINDSKQLQLYINSSQPKVQIYNPNGGTYTPSWTTSKPVLTPQLFIAGTSTDIIRDAKSVKWFIDGVELLTSNSNYTLATGGQSVTINSNVLASANTKLFVCEVVYTDIATGFDVTAKADIEFAKVSAGQDGAQGQTGATGSAGQDAINTVLWTPNGNTIRNSTGSLIAKVDVYKGSAIVTPTAFKWYIQDPTATTSSGGDADGGAGWRLLNSSYNEGTSGYTTATLTIPATAITSIESFKCVVTYASKKYQDVCTVMDVTDPIQVAVTGTSVFKNGQGSTTLTAKLYQAGVEVDERGNEGYVYTWSLYDSNNVKSTFSKTGKTITVDADDVNVRGNIVCDVSK